MITKPGINIALILFIATFIYSCSDSGGNNKSTRQKTGAKINIGTDPLIKRSAPKHNFDSVKAANAKKLYIENCSQCHGENGEGGPDWKKPDENGKYPPPPLNGTGHAWHHPMSFLRNHIKHGSKDKGGAMDAFGGSLSDAEIDDIINWFQSKWPDEIYAAWYRQNVSPRKQ